MDYRGLDYGNAILGACFEGQDKVVEILLERSAEVEARVAIFGNVLQASCYIWSRKQVPLSSLTN